MNTPPSFLALDFETANYSADSACAIGLVKVKNGKIIKHTEHLIRPPTRHFDFTGIHGITWNDVTKAPTFGELWGKFAEWFDDIDFIAAHSASFDKRVLLACCARYKIAAPKTPFTCSVRLARQTWGIYPTKLPDVCRHLRIEVNHHNALSDATACAKIVLAAKAA